jgi:hypothetical protein
VYILLISLSLLGLAAYLWLPLSDPDLWWHITIGRWIVSERQVPNVDLWNQFSGEAPFRAYSWSSEVLLAVVDQQFGLFGLMMLKICLSVFLVVCLAYCLIKIADDLIFGLGILGILIAGLSPYFGLRPQSLSWVLFALALYLGQNIWREQKITWKQYFGILLLFSIWANTHITGALGMLCLGAWVLQSGEKKCNWKLSLIVLSAAFIGSLLTPYFGGEWATLAGKSNHPFAHTYIREFQPATLYHVSANILVLLGVLFFLFSHYKPKSTPILHIVLTSTFCIAGFAIQKFLPYALILVSILLCSIWRSHSRDRGAFANIGNGLHLLFDYVRAMPKPLAAVFCLILLPTIFINARESLLSPIDTNRVPVFAVDFIQNNDLPRPLLHGFNEGGYLLYKTSNKSGIPSEKVVIDGRTNINNPEIVQEFLAALYAKPNWDSIFKRLEPQTILWENGFPLSTLLDESQQWCKVFPAEKNSHWSVYLHRKAWLPIKHRLRSLNCT